MCASVYYMITNFKTDTRLLLFYINISIVCDYRFPHYPTCCSQTLKYVKLCLYQEDAEMARAWTWTPEKPAAEKPSVTPKKLLQAQASPAKGAAAVPMEVEPSPEEGLRNLLDSLRLGPLCGVQGQVFLKALLLRLRQPVRGSLRLSRVCQESLPRLGLRRQATRGDRPRKAARTAESLLRTWLCKATRTGDSLARTCPSKAARTRDSLRRTCRRKAARTRDSLRRTCHLKAARTGDSLCSLPRRTVSLQVATYFIL